jgi:hypothetical protein
MTTSTTPSAAPPTYDAPPPPKEGQLFGDSQGGVWKVRRLTIAPNPVGFYLVHMAYGPGIDDLRDSLVLGPREFAALVRERDLKSNLHNGV